MDIIKLMAEYNLTLRCWPTHRVYQISYREGQPLEEGDKIIEREMKDLTGKPVIVKRIQREEFHEPKWGVKIDDWPQWTKYDFYGATPEEAITKAIEHIKNN